MKIHKCNTVAFIKSSSYLARRKPVMISRATYKKLKQGIFQMLTLLLLVLYITGTSEPEILHSFIHDHEHEVAHSEEQEQDPCHRLIYHGDVQKGCGHDSHLIVSDKCDMCELACHTDQIWVDIVSGRSVKYEKEYFSLYKENLDNYWAVISSSRAPPALI